MTIARVNLDVPEDEKLAALVQISVKADGTLQARLMHVDLELEARIDTSRLSEVLRWLADAADIEAITTIGEANGRSET